MSAENVKTVVALYDAFRERDVATVMKHLDSDVIFSQTELLPWGGEYRGQAGAIGFFTKLLASVESEVETERLIDAGDHVVQMGRTRGRTRRSGRAFDIAEVHLWRFQDGKVIGFQAFIDTPGMLAALQD